jgi:hypothetical protein
LRKSGEGAHCRAPLNRILGPAGWSLSPPWAGITLKAWFKGSIGGRGIQEEKL